MTELSLHTIKPKQGSKKSSKRLGRGPGSGKGKTAGRGMKGQRSRSGGRKGLKLKGMKQMLLRIPKSRGFKSGKPVIATITLSQLDRWATDGSEVTVAKLIARNLIPSKSGGAKVVNSGEIKKKVKLIGIAATPKALEAIQAAGGTIEVAKNKKVK